MPCSAARSLPRAASGRRRNSRWSSTTRCSSASCGTPTVSRCCLSKVDLAGALAWMERGDWQKAHAIVQVDENSPLVCWAHGITHLMEGDLANARYWYRE